MQGLVGNARTQVGSQQEATGRSTDMTSSMVQDFLAHALVQLQRSFPLPLRMSVHLIVFFPVGGDGKGSYRTYRNPMPLAQQYIIGIGCQQLNGVPGFDVGRHAIDPFEKDLQVLNGVGSYRVQAVHSLCRHTKGTTNSSMEGVTNRSSNASVRWKDVVPPRGTEMVVRGCRIWIVL